MEYRRIIERLHDGKRTFKFSNSVSVKYSSMPYYIVETTAIYPREKLMFINESWVQLS